MSYKFTTDKIETRSIKEGDNPRYVVNGRGMVSGLPDTYEFRKNPDGTYKTFHSIFTDNCLKSIKKQATQKKLFVDAQHDLALNTNINSVLKDKLSSDELSKVNKMLKLKELPIAKLNDIDIKDNSLMIYSELNPSFRNLDAEHQAYFDSVWYSLENKFLNGISANFANPKVIKNEDNEMVIDDLDVLGFSYVEGAAHHENNIMEVAIRMAQEGENMSEENETKPVDNTEVLKQMQSMKAELDGLKADKAKAEADAKQREEQEAQKTVEEQKLEQQKTIADLQKTVEDLKAAQSAPPADNNNSAKGTVPPTDKYNAQQQPPEKHDDKFYAENLKEITSEHAETIKTIKDGKEPGINNMMKGFGQLVNLQAQLNNPTAGMKFEHPEDRIMAEKILKEKGAGDIVVPRAKI